MSNPGPMIADFFGKKMGRMMTRAVANFSPIELAARNQAHKGSMQGMARSRSTWKGFWTGVGESRALRRQAGGGNYSLRDYFSGFNVEDAASSRRWGTAGVNNNNGMILGGMSKLPEQIRMRRQAFRVGVPAALVGGAALNMAVGDNPISRTVSTTSSLAIAGGMTAVAGRVNPYAGLLVGGWSALNALQRGNQFGPF